MPPGLHRSSLYRDACRAAGEYRVQLSAKLGDRAEPTAGAEWNREHWWRWAGARVIEHLTGEAFWLELDASKFASISSETPDRLRLLDELRSVDRRLNHDGQIAFAEKNALSVRWAEIVNRLLD